MRTPFLVSSSFLVAALTVYPLHASHPVTPVILSDQRAPGIRRYATLTRISDATVLPSGDIFFGGTLGGRYADPRADNAFWVGRTGALRLAARDGSPTPGADATFRNMYGPWGYPNGAAVIGAQVTSGDSLAWGIWQLTDTSTRALAISGSSAPGIAGARFRPVEHAGSEALNATANGSGLTLVGAALDGPGVTAANDSALFLGPSAALAPVVREGDPAPIGNGNRFGQLDFVHMRINASGTIAFSTPLVGGGVPSATFVGVPGNLKPVAGFGDPVPGAENELRLRSPTYLNAPTSAGNVIFSAALSDAQGNDLGYDYGVFSAGPSSLRTIARRGLPAPGTGGTFGAHRPGLATWFPHSNAHGGVTFLAEIEGAGVSGDTDTGLWAGAVDGLNLVARAGEQAPGLGHGVTFQRLDGTRGFDAWPTINDAGHVVFGASLSGPGVSEANDGSIWAYGGDGVPTLIVREGDYLDVGAGRERGKRQVQSLFDQGTNRDWFALGSDGDLVFRATFTDGTHGLFHTLIPEPAALAWSLAALALLGVGRRVSRRPVSS